MAKLTITQSAKAAGIGRATLYRHIKEGKLSCEIDRKGQKIIDTAELIRVYGEIRDTEISHENLKRHETEQSETNETLDKTGVLQQKVEYLEEQVKELRKDKEDLQKDKEASRKREEGFLDVIKKQQALLLPPGDTEKAGKKTSKTGFFGRLFGGKKSG